MLIVLGTPLFKSMVDRIEKEKAQLRDQIASLEKTVSKLEQDVSSMKERERLMVEYPDLNGPVNANMTGNVYSVHVLLSMPWSLLQFKM